MRRRMLIAGALLLAVPLTGCTSERDKCENAVMREYMNADRVFQQPTDLNAFCATWNNHPPGVDTPGT